MPNNLLNHWHWVLNIQQIYGHKNSVFQFDQQIMEADRNTHCMDAVATQAPNIKYIDNVEILASTVLK